MNATPFLWFLRITGVFSTPCSFKTFGYSCSDMPYILLWELPVMQSEGAVEFSVRRVPGKDYCSEYRLQSWLVGYSPGYASDINN